MNTLIEEAVRMPDASIDVARQVSWVRTPEHLEPLRELVHRQHGGALRKVFDALEKRFNHTRDDFLNVFRAAADLALMEAVGGNSLSADDRHTYVAFTVGAPAPGALAPS